MAASDQRAAMSAWTEHRQGGSKAKQLSDVRGRGALEVYGTVLVKYRSCTVSMCAERVVRWPRLNVGFTSDARTRVRRDDRTNCVARRKRRWTSKRQPIMMSVAGEKTGCPMFEYTVRVL